MLTEFKLPGLGENIKSGIATKVMVAPGDVIKQDQSILELETDKAVLEVPSTVSGTVKEVLVKAGSEVKVGQVIMKIETTKSLSPAMAGPDEDMTRPPTKLVPESISRGTFGGDSFGINAKAKEETIKAKPIDVCSSNGINSKRTNVEILTTINDFDKEKVSKFEPTAPTKDVAAAPSVRRFAREIGIDISQVPGSGPAGRISIEDVKAFAKQLNTSGRSSSGTATIMAQPLPDFTKWGAIERKPMNMVRKKTAEHLAYAWTSIPHVTQFDKANITELENLRKRFAKKVESMGGKLTITAFILKVIASGLKTFPQFNASIDIEKNEVIYKKYFNIGVAVDTARGLLVPVIRDVDKKNIMQLSVELNEMAERARTKKTTIEEMQGGSFTITNLGGIGGTSFTPIVNSPEVAILGLSRSTMEPVYVNNEFVPKLMLPLSLSYDHRLIDGADGTRFLRWVCEAIQQPFLMDLGG